MWKKIIVIIFFAVSPSPYFSSYREYVAWDNTEFFFFLITLHQETIQMPTHSGRAMVCVTLLNRPDLGWFP